MREHSNFLSCNVYFKIWLMWQNNKFLLSISLHYNFLRVWIIIFSILYSLKYLFLWGRGQRWLYIGFSMQCYAFFSRRCGTVMFPTLVLWKIKGVKIGLPETRISLNFQGVAPNLYMEQINTWIIFLRSLTMYFPFTFLDSVYESSTILMFIIHML